MKEKEHLNHLPARCLCLAAGLSIMAFGVAFSIKAALGTSPISSVPYVTSAISGLSVGTATILLNCIFALLQILLLRRQYEIFQLLQIPASVLFGLMIDVGKLAIQGIPCGNYFQQWLLCMTGMVLIALGVTVEVTAGLVTTAGEGMVVTLSRVLNIKFGNMKVIFDISLVCIAVLLAFLFLGHLEGVREGTVAAAVCVGLFTKLFKKPAAAFEKRFLS